MKDIFSELGLKRTKARQIIFQQLLSLNKPVSSEELYEMLKDEYGINLATVYRNLKTLEDLNVVVKILRQDGIAYYSLSRDGHSHYMVCDVCNDHLELDSCPIDLDRINKINKNGFKSTGHILEIHGICKKCQENK